VGLDLGRHRRARTAASPEARRAVERGLVLSLLRLQPRRGDRGLPETAEAWAHMKAATTRAGVTIETADIRIAATAVASGLTLVAHDGIFRAIPGLRLVCHAPPR
jgi:predicted nucleic acid-binding protein